MVTPAREHPFRLERDGGDQHLFDLQTVECCGDPHHVEQRVVVTELVQLHFRRFHAVDAGLGLS